MELEQLIGYLDAEETDEKIPMPQGNGDSQSISDRHVFGDDDDLPDDDEETPENQTDNLDNDNEEEEEQEKPNNSSKLPVIDKNLENNDSDTPDNSSQDSSIYTEYFNLLQDNGMLFLDDSFEFDGTIEGLEKALSQTKNNLPNEAYKAFWERLPDEWKPALRYAIAGGTDVAKYLQTFESKKLEDLDIENSVEDQKEVLRTFYKKTTRYDDAKITKFIDRLQAMGDLEEEAVQALDELKAVEQQERNALAEQEEAARQAALNEWKERRDNLSNLIESSSFIEKDRKGKVKAYLFNELKHGSGEYTTQFDSTLRAISQNPEHLVQLADLLLDSYDSKKGFNLERFTQKTASKAVKNIRQRLEAIDNNKINLRGEAPKARTLDVN